MAIDLDKEIIKKIPSKFSIMDVPDPDGLEAEFVYNFFTPDERFNSDGSSKVNFSDGSQNLGDLSKMLADQENKPLDFNVPRYITLSWNQPFPLQNQYEQDPDQSPYVFVADKEDINFEQDYVTRGYGVMQLSDPECLTRVKQKYEALSKILDLNFSQTDQSQVLATRLGLETLKSKFVNPLIALTPDQFLVNFIPAEQVSNLYSNAAENKILCQVSKEAVGTYLLNGEDDASPLSSISELESLQNFSQIVNDNSPVNETESDSVYEATPISGNTFTDFLYNEAELIENVPDPLLGLKNIQHIGYMIEKTQLNSMGKKIDPQFQNGTIQRILIKNPDVTKFLDSKITYGSRYSYVIKNVYRIKGIARNVSDGEAYNLSTVVASMPSIRRTVKTVEYQAPKPPDGLFYKFNYNQGRGLVLTWQMPPGKTRDVKYFQVFKRFSINEPFQCIAEISFNDTDRSQNPPPDKPEKVRRDLIIPEKYPKTYFVDFEFDRNSSPTIYAVCAVDAHGLTSGYSTQSKVSFNRPKNRIDIEYVSKLGAPKQYPNFFVDPRMDDNITIDSFSQDAIYDSQSEKITVYFDPDSKVTESGPNLTKTFSYKNDVDKSGNYKIHFINLDLQKSTTCQIEISEQPKS